MNRVGIFLILLSTASFVSTAEHPNVLFIAIDDLNDWGASGLEGEPFAVDTPNLDRLVAQGVLFTNAHCNAPSCNPSRTSILSGLHPATTGVYANRNDWRTNTIFDDTLLLPEYFKQHGYATFGCGKIYHANEEGAQDCKGYISPRGWDGFFPSFERQLPEPSRPVQVPGRGIGKFDWGGTGKPLEDMGDHKVVDWAIGQLKKKHQQPLFLAVGIYRPHMPWFIPDAFYDRYEDVKIKPPQNAPGWDADIPPQLTKMRRFKEFAGQPGPSRGYAACVTYADFELGRLLDALEASPLSENTLIVLWSDHGWHLGEKEHFSKFTLWEESTRVPLIIVPPGARAPRVVDTAVSLLDVYPTVIQLAGLAAYEKNQGENIMSFVDVPKDARRAVVTSAKEDAHAVRDGRYRYIRIRDVEALFDHETDPDELRNVADDPAYADVVERLAKALPANPLSQMPKTPEKEQ